LKKVLKFDITRPKSGFRSPKKVLKIDRRGFKLSKKGLWGGKRVKRKF